MFYIKFLSESRERKLHVTDKNVRKPPPPIPSGGHVPAPPVSAAEPRETIYSARTVRVLRTVGLLLPLLLIIVIPTAIILGRGTRATNNIAGTITRGRNINIYQRTDVFMFCVEY